MKNKTLPFNLQYFASSPQNDGAGADDNGSGADGAADNTAGGEGSGTDAGGTAEPTFDDVLKGGHQAEFDRRVQKAVNTAIGNAQKKWQALTNDKLSEAERLAQMSECEFPYKSRIMRTIKHLKILKSPYMARNPMKWGFFKLIRKEIPLKI